MVTCTDSLMVETMHKPKHSGRFDSRGFERFGFVVVMSEMLTGISGKARCEVDNAAVQH